MHNPQGTPVGFFTHVVAIAIIAIAITKENEMHDPLKVIKEKDAPLFDQICKGRELAFKEGAISAKNKFLIAMTIDAVEGSVSGVRALAKMALDSGATKEEITEALRIAFFISGVVTTFTAAQALQDIL